MSTNSTLGYFDDNGIFRGCTIHYDGMTVGGVADGLLKERGRDWLVAWVEAGIAGNGYSAMGADEKPYGDIPELEPQPISLGQYFDTFSLEYGWVITADGVKAIEAHLFEERRNDLSFWECWGEAEQEAAREPMDDLRNLVLMLAVERIASEKFGDQPEVHGYIEQRLNALASR